MRLLLLQAQVWVPSLGGGNKANRCLLEELHDRGHSCTALCRALTTRGGPTNEEEFLAELSGRGVAVDTADPGIYSFAYRGVDVRAVDFGTRSPVHETAELIRDLNPDWIVVSDDRDHQLLEVALLAAPERTVVLVQTVVQLPFGPLAARQNPRQGELLRSARALFVISEFAREYIARHGEISSHLFRPPVYGGGPFHRLGRPDHGFVTTINPCIEKGLPIFLALAAERPDLEFAAVPTWGADEKTLRSLAEAPNVRLLEPADEVDEILEQTRVLLAPSLWPETFGYVVVEAMLRGIPVLASDIGGLPEAMLGVDYLLPVAQAVRRGESWESPEQDVSPWLAVLDELLSDKESYELCSRKSHRAALEFVATVDVQQFEDLLAMPRSQSVPAWLLVAEFGLDYSAGDGSEGDLRFPVSLERGADGTYLIVDEIGLPKNLTVLSECRTLRVAPSGEILFDSLEAGMSDAFGCFTNDGMALLRRTTWELQLLSSDGSLRQTIDLSLFTQHLPRLVSWTSRGTFLIASLDHVFDVDLLEVDAQGRLLWYLPKKDAIGCPTSIQLLESGNILIADEFGHVAVEVGRDGAIEWRYGRLRHPSAAPGMLSNPMGARELADGRRLIADTRNHRILSVDEKDSGTPLELGAELCAPTWADDAGDGHYLICEAGNRRAVELDGQRVVWQYGEPVVQHRDLSFPRSVELLPNGALLVADTGHDRVVTLDPGGANEWPVEGVKPLFWPRCARLSPSGTLIVADGRNSRILEVSARGSALHELSDAGSSGELSLRDPHDVRLLAGDRLLITDSAAHRVVETDWEGRVRWSVDRETVGLRDPHSAQQLADGTVLISDTANGRLVWVDLRGRIVREFMAFSSSGFLCRLDRPRYAETYEDGTLLVVDSGNNRVLAGDRDGNLLWELSRVPMSRQAHLQQPRWAQLISQNELLVSDHSNHRVLRLRLASDSA